MNSCLGSGDACNLEIKNVATNLLLSIFTIVVTLYLVTISHYKRLLLTVLKERASSGIFYKSLNYIMRIIRESNYKQNGVCKILKPKVEIFLQNAILGHPLNSIQICRRTFLLGCRTVAKWCRCTFSYCT